MMNGQTLVWVVAAALAGAPAAANDNPLAGFHGFWSRETKAGSAVADATQRPEGKDAGPSIRVEHRGQKDWSLTGRERLTVAAGDVLEIAADLRAQGAGQAGISVVTYDARGKTVEWTYGQADAPRGARWQRVRNRLIVPPGVVAVVPRLTGHGPATVWMHRFTCTRAGTIRDRIAKDLPEQITVSNAAISATFHTADATLTVLDRRVKRTWRQQAREAVIVLDARKVAGGLDADLLDIRRSLPIALTLRLDAEAPECTLAVSAKGPLAYPLAYPYPFATRAGTYLVVPMNEGISYPVDDPAMLRWRLVAYGGHGICMPFWGVTDGRTGQMAILETPDDAAIGFYRTAGLGSIGPQWDPQKGQFGYERRLRYVFFDRGGHVAMCKRYRAYVRKTGLLKTLAQKRKEVPAVDRLVGAVNVWCWDRDAVAIVREMRAAGIERILWSHRGSPESLRAMNDMPGVLTSRYDIYQDVMNPANFKYLRGRHADWPTEAWPNDLMLDARGQWRPGWRVKCTDGKMRPCGVLCDRQAIPYAEQRVSKELKTHPYRCRFIDTTTASPWRECYDPNHPMTRTDSRVWKMKLLDLMSRRFKLVTGSETGHDAAVPFVHYFEGMMSLGPYRVPDAGRDMARIWTDVPERVAKFQLGHRYRLPLWELVYHDCVVAQWYWGDYNNKLPSLWLKRDLFNALYGTPPMFMFRRDYWQKNKARFAQSYRATCPLARKVGYSEMTDHRFLTPDRDVQQTTFANGTTVTVNFGDKAYAAGDLKLPPRSRHVVHAKGR